MNPMVSVYVLIDPRTGGIRYVGITKMKCEDRLRCHLRDRDDNYRTRWISALVRNGMVPIMRLVQPVCISEWSQAERYWISHFRNAGCRLVNLTDGGEGSLNPSDETRLKMRLSHLGKSLSHEQKAKISAANKGRKMTPEQVAKIKAWQAQRPQISEYTRSKLSAAKLGRTLSDQHKDKISSALQGRVKSAETKARMKAARAKRQPVSHEARARMSAARRLYVELNRG